MELGAGEVGAFLDGRGIGHRLAGNLGARVDGYSMLDAVSDGKITWVKNWSAEIGGRLDRLHDLIVVCGEDAEVGDGGRNCYVLCANQKAAFFEILGEFFSRDEEGEGIEPTARVLTDRVGRGCHVGDFAYVGEEVELSDGVRIGCHATITGRVRIGRGSIIGPGTVIGEPGFGYYDGVDGHKRRAPHLGGVLIGDHVEVGANSCIDRGTMGDTVIGSHSKIDNLCHIGHNVQVGEDAVLVAGSVLCGSSRIGDGGYISPGAVVMNQVGVGKDAFVGMQTAAIRDVADGESVFGIPGRKIKRDYKI